MKLRLLLILMVLGGMLNAQEPNRSLIISEVRNHAHWNTHVELTNMGTTPVNLGEFKMGRVLRMYDLNEPDAWRVKDSRDKWLWLPEVVLQPNESYVIATAIDFGPLMYKLGNREPGLASERPQQTEILDLADYLLHKPETGGYPDDPRDSVTMDYSYAVPDIHAVLGWGIHSHAIFIEHHFAEGDSATVDQVLGVFDNNGANSNQGYDVAGVYKATTNTLIVRKASITTGNLEFVRGVSAEDSEWIVSTYPVGYDGWRDLWWTVGNHGSYVLDANTLESDVIGVDFANKTLTVPWGVRRLDDIMRHMKKKPGIVWEYHLNPNRADSLYRSARTGDQLTVSVVGDMKHSATFNIIVSEPTADANIVVPIDHENMGSVAENGPITLNAQSGILSWPRVTTHETGVDTITGVWFGLPNALRTDTLMKYLEKPSNAEWEFVFVDGNVRPDLIDGDKLKVTSQSGSVKEYFIQVQPYEPTSRNFYLSAITWPDIPESYKGIYGWIGDTIPGFNSTTYNYNVEIPFDVSGIPALVATKSSTNATVEVIRATTLSGTPEDRTISFIVTSESGAQATYKVELSKQKEPSKVQPYDADPFISEYVYKDQTINNYMEVVNPGNQILDLSNYMFVSNRATNPGDAIRAEDPWVFRFNKYIPGYKYVDEAQWAVTPGVLVQDVGVNPLVMPGDVFTWAYIWGDGKMTGSWWPWKVLDELDIIFNNFDSNKYAYRNPWGETVGWDQYSTASSWNRFRGTPLSEINNWSHIYVFEILNDSIKQGTKVPNDPNDFRLVDAWGMADGSAWNIAGSSIPKKYNIFQRKPEIYQGNTEIQASFGTNADDSEWTHDDEVKLAAKGLNYRMCMENIGKHFMYEPTQYKSTVTSLAYKVSEGYLWDESIKGVTTGTTAGTFMDNLYKANEGQVLKVLSADSGEELATSDQLSMNDVLVVLSADGENTTKYTVDVSTEGLSSDALLKSNVYEIVVEPDPKSASDDHVGSGTIKGFEYGTQLTTILSNITVPEGASMSIINSAGAYVPLQLLNYDTIYVNTTVNSEIYFDVIAENSINRIMYQLLPTTSQNDAFLLSDFYEVLQMENLVKFVPRGTNVQTFFSNTVVSTGATAKIVDKMGYERTQGGIREDDKIVVTSANGLLTRVYHISFQKTELVAANYLAYVLSDVYSVDQVDYVISEGLAQLTALTPLSEFYSSIILSMGATAVVVDINGNEKTTGDLDDGDRLRVTSADGKIVTMYDLNLDLTSAGTIGLQQIEIYPNPTNGELKISGIEPGNRIQIYSATGAVIRDLKARNNLEVLSLEDVPSGMFVIVIHNDNQILGRFKFSRVHSR